jgi:hypothetical protein
MKRLRFSLRNLILLTTAAGMFLGYSQSRKRSILGVGQTLSDYGYVVKTPDSLCDLVWQRSPRVQRNYGAPTFHPLLDHWWQRSPRLVIVQFDARNNQDKKKGLLSPSEETMEVLGLCKRLKTFGVQEIYVDVAYSNVMVTHQEFESRSLALTTATAPKPRTKKEGARPDDQDTLPHSIASQAE